jgi:8-oxo-dGTP pyrophosphatase MutT (NUDIX family)
MTGAQKPIARWCAAALLVTADGRYLMQRRDDRPDILLPDHWALFGGTVDTGETAEAAIRRELAEELEFRAGAVDAFSEIVIELPFAPPRWDRMSFFAVPLTLAEEAAMVQHEGAGRRLFAPEDLAAEPRVAPWDLAAVLMHARRRTLFERPSAPIRR